MDVNEDAETSHVEKTARLIALDAHIEEATLALHRLHAEKNKLKNELVPDRPFEDECSSADADCELDSLDPSFMPWPEEEWPNDRLTLHYLCHAVERLLPHYAHMAGDTEAWPPEEIQDMHQTLHGYVTTIGPWIERLHKGWTEFVKEVAALAPHEVRDLDL